VKYKLSCRDCSKPVIGTGQLCRNCGPTTCYYLSDEISPGYSEVQSKKITSICTECETTLQISDQIPAKFCFYCHSYDLGWKDLNNKILDQELFRSKNVTEEDIWIKADLDADYSSKYQTGITEFHKRVKTEVEIIRGRIKNIVRVKEPPSFRGAELEPLSQASLADVTAFYGDDSFCSVFLDELQIHDWKISKPSDFKSMKSINSNTEVDNSEVIGRILGVVYARIKIAEPQKIKIDNNRVTNPNTFWPWLPNAEPDFVAPTFKNINSNKLSPGYNENNLDPNNHQNLEIQNLTSGSVFIESCTGCNIFVFCFVFAIVSFVCDITWGLISIIPLLLRCVLGSKPFIFNNSSELNFNSTVGSFSSDKFFNKDISYKSNLNHLSAGTESQKINKPYINTNDNFPADSNLGTYLSKDIKNPESQNSSFNPLDKNHTITDTSSRETGPNENLYKTNINSDNDAITNPNINGSLPTNKLDTNKLNHNTDNSTLQKPRYLTKILIISALIILTVAGFTYLSKINVTSTRVIESDNKNSSIVAENLSKETSNPENTSKAEISAPSQYSSGSTFKELISKQESTREINAKKFVDKNLETKETASKNTLTIQAATKEAAANEANAKQTTAKEAAAKEIAAREIAAKDSVAKQAAAKDAASQEAMVKKEQANKAAVKERTANDLVAKDALALQSANKEAANKQALAIQQAVKEAAAKESEARELVAKEALAKQEAAKVFAAKEALAKEEAKKLQAERQASKLASLQLTKDALKNNDLQAFLGNWRLVTGLYATSTGEPINIDISLNKNGEGSSSVFMTKSLNTCSGTAKAVIIDENSFKVEMSPKECDKGGNFIRSNALCKIGRENKMINCTLSCPSESGCQTTFVKR
jgi:hypothetical protein